MNDFIKLKLSCKNLIFNNLCCGSGRAFLTFSKPRMTSVLKRQMDQENLTWDTPVNYKPGQVAPGGGSSVNNLQMDWLKTHQTEFCPMTTPNPVYKELTMTASKMCSGNYNIPMKIEWFEYSSDGAHGYKGETMFTMNDLIQRRMRNFEFWNKLNKNKGCGQLYIDGFSTEPNYSFMDYLNGGISMSTVICIDFTQSNLPCSDPNS
jgi:hypothetical protein